MAAVSHLVRWFRNHHTAADGLLAAALLAISLVASVSVDAEPGQREFDALGWGLLVAVSLPLAWRRTATLAAAWSIVPATMAFWVLDYPDNVVGPALLIAVYSVAAHIDRPRSMQHGVAIIATTVGVGVAGVISPEEDLPWFAVPAFFVMYATAWILGDNLRTRRAYLVELERTAAHLEARRRAEAEQAVEHERTRIARELHDVVAHSMSVMVVQAGAARRMLDVDPGRASDALAAIESTGREALNEMRRILGVLRSEDDLAELVPAPALADLDQLVEKCARAGLSVDVAVDGSPTPLPASLELSAYRIVQESLTNTLKHAGPARASVHLAFGDGNLRVDVVDDGRGAAAAPATPGSGQGLVGMRERVEAFGGTLTAGPRTGGGYAVAAVLPIDGGR